MAVVRYLGRKIQALFFRESIHRELDEEMRTHLALRARALEREGASPEAARSAASLRFGNRAAWTERAGEPWAFPRLESMAQEIRYGARALRRNPAFTATAILIIAVGMGATTAVFS